MKTYVRLGSNCPFKERDLQNGEVCYYGNGVDMCPWFKRYCWGDEHDSHIECTHPPLQRYVQLSLFD